MATAENAKLEYEAGQSPVPNEALTNSGDNLTYTSTGSLWSAKSGSTVVVTSDGLKTGGAVTPAASLNNDQVDVTALTANVDGAERSVTAQTDVAITRAATDVAVINSITVTNAGAVAVVKGTDSTDATFSEVRGAAGGPPLIATTSIEIAQVRVTTNTAGPIVASEIFATVGTHLERADFPLWTENIGAGSITFFSALPLIHTGPVTKQVYAAFSTPIFAEVSLAAEFVPPETTHSVSSTQVYNRTIAASSSSLGAGSFTAYVIDGVTDGLVKDKNERLWFRFTPDRFKAPHLLANGTLGVTRAFPADDNMSVECTIAAETDTIEKES